MKALFSPVAFILIFYPVSAYSLSASDEPNREHPRETALKFLQILGANVPESSGRCSSCHGTTAAQITHWGTRARETFERCFFGLDVTGDHDPFPELSRRDARAAINCMRKNPDDPASEWDKSRLGLYTARSHLNFFRKLFAAAYNPQRAAREHRLFTESVRMPPGGQNLITQQESGLVADWVLKGMPYIGEILLDSDPPSTCSEEYSQEFFEHIHRMAREGWEQRNKENGILMYACGAAQTALECFKQQKNGIPLFPQPDTLSFGSGWKADFDGQTLRILRTINFPTSYWIRSSADGRFVGIGRSGYLDNNDSGSGNPDTPAGKNQYHSSIADLNTVLTGEANRDIPVKAEFDPGFFPDNSGFIFQETPNGTGMCTQSILEDLRTTSVDFTEEACMSDENAQVSLYQGVGASLDGSDYLAVTGPFANDTGRDSLNNHRQFPFGPLSTATFTPVIHDGSAYRLLAGSEVVTPFEGDFNLSPSNQLMIGRITGEKSNGEAGRLGYQFYRIQKQRTSGGYRFIPEKTARICLKGNKGKMSFDERMFVTFHHVEREDFREYGFDSPDHPEFSRWIEAGVANIILKDLYTGQSYRLTRMKPGQLALFPHFRSDGWIYFLVFDQGTGNRWIVASDAAVRISLQKVLRPVSML